MSCSGCKKSHFIKPKSYGFWSGLLLILLPKCPFCLVAYSSTVALCTSGPGAIPAQHDNTNALIVSLSLSLVILGSVLINFRGWRTWLALLISMSGIVVLNSSLYYCSGSPWYYTGVVLTFFGVWINGSLFYFIRQWAQPNHLFSFGFSHKLFSNH